MALRGKNATGYTPLAEIIAGFAAATHLAPAKSEIYSDLKELVQGRRLFYRSLDRKRAAKTNAADLPGVVRQLGCATEDRLCSEPMALELYRFAVGLCEEYLRDFVGSIATPSVPASDVMDRMTRLFFGPKIAVLMRRLEARYGISMLDFLLDACKGSAAMPVGVALRWIREVQDISRPEAAARAKSERPEVIVKQMERWESGKVVPNIASQALIDEVYGLKGNPRYALWAFLALALANAPRPLRDAIVDSRGKPYDGNVACAAIQAMSREENGRIVPPECYVKLHSLLAPNSCIGYNEPGPVVKTEVERLLAEFEDYLNQHENLERFYLYHLRARYLVFSRQPSKARGEYEKAIAGSHCVDPNAHRQLLREYAALAEHEGYTVPLRYANDEQWHFRNHPLQTRRMPLEDDETPEQATDMKRWVDYHARFFQKTLFFDWQKPEEQEA